MTSAQLIVRAAALYSLGGAATFLTPGALELLGMAPPDALWLWLPSIFGCFVAVVLWFSARDLETYGAFPYWNGVFRLSFVVAAFAFDLGSVGGHCCTNRLNSGVPLSPDRLIPRPL